MEVDDDNNGLSINNSYVGFQKWIRLSVDDFPPIRPPRRHMLSHVTGGLTELYSSIKKEEKQKEKKKEQLKNNDSHPTSSTDEVKDLEEISKTNDAEDVKLKANRRDDEGGGRDMTSDDNETSPYTDEEGEFCPDKSIPLLASRYKYVEVLARGQSALIIKALDTFAKNKPIAIKVLHRVYKPIGSQEADILLEVHRADPWLHVPFARLLNQFIYGPHYCLVFDFLSPIPMYTHYDQKQIKGIKSLPHVRNLCVKLLTVLGFLHKQNVIHADLKPENILLVDEEDMASVMVIDFGNALRNTEEELSLYYTDFELQTLLYRAPEVIFGLKFSLEIDMWSLGCLLAECYTGEPLFMGKTKEDILMKMTKLLGPFPKEFEEGECAEEFSAYIGKTLTRYQRVENLRKRLNNCQDINFLLLLEKLLTYIPGLRISPFEAACHPFVASVNPFLYLSSSEEHKRYPTVILDMTTYPYLPEFPKDETNPVAIKGRKRLEAYSKSLFDQGNASLCNHHVSVPMEKTPLTNSIVNNQTKLQQHIPPPISTVTSTSTTNAVTTVAKTIPATNTTAVVDSVTTTIATTTTASTVIATTSSFIASTTNSLAPSKSKVQVAPLPTTEPMAKPKPVLTPPIVSPPNVTSPKPKITPEDSLPQQDNESQDSKPAAEAPQPLLSPSVPSPSPTPSQSSITERLPSVSPTPSSSSESSQTQSIPVMSKVQIDRRHTKSAATKEELVKIKQLKEQMQSGNYSRTDVKQTLKSMGLRCEDFTISVYSKEQAHAILRKQGVEVTNHAPTRSNQNVLPKGNPRQIKGNSGIRPSVSVVRSEASRPPPSIPEKKVEDDDDDDCIILDPPEGAKLPPPPPPVRRFPQQFQLMGTTVQVNRGAKRQMRAMSRQAPMPKRVHRPRSSYYYNDGGYNYEESAETSVQDTLKRLKNYNISITCRRNSSQRNPRVHSMDSDDDMDHDGHIDSEDEEDMAKYLECEIDEEKEQMREGDESYDLDSSGSIADISYEDSINEPGKSSTPIKGDLRHRSKIKDVEKLNKTVELEEEKESTENPDKQSEVEKKDENSIVSSEMVAETESDVDTEKTDDINSETNKKNKPEPDKDTLIESDKNDKVPLENLNVSDDENKNNEAIKASTSDTATFVSEIASTKLSENVELGEKDVNVKEASLTSIDNEKVDGSESVKEADEELSLKDLKEATEELPLKDLKEVAEELPLKDLKEAAENSVSQINPMLPNSTNAIIRPIPIRSNKFLSEENNTEDEDINEELENQLLEDGGNLDDEEEGLDNLEFENEL